MNNYILVLTTVPNKETGQRIASALVEDRLAACVTTSSLCQSSYWWQGKISKDPEYILFIKTEKKHYPKLEKKILEIHPYEVPEIIALPLVGGYSKYLEWITKETK